MADLIIASLRGGKTPTLNNGLRTRENLAWAAGLFEGEGSFTFMMRDGKYGAIVAELGMTDEDRVRQFHKIIGVGNVTTHPKPLKAHWKTMHIWKTASFEGAQAVICMLWPWLGPRRRNRALELLRAYRDARINRQSRATVEEVAKVRTLLAIGISKRAIARQMNKSYGFVNHIKSGRTHQGAEVAP